MIRTNADELYALPWEAMPLGLNGPPLTEVPKLMMLYHEPGVSTLLAPNGPPRAALLAWSAGEKKGPHERVAEALGPKRTLDEPSLDSSSRRFGSESMTPWCSSPTGAGRRAGSPSAGLKSA